MTEEEIEVARMLSDHADFTWGVPGDYLIMSRSGFLKDHGHIPDLSDPATRGVLLAMVRERYKWGGCFAALDYDGTTWGVFVHDDQGIPASHGPTEGIALAHALLAAK